jgi:O-glycosyl hydrolase
MQDIDQVGFENPDGRKVLVVINSGGAKDVVLTQANKTAEVTLAPDSLTTLSWS